MGFKSISGIIILSVALLVVGCQQVYDLWPVHIPKDIYKYNNQDPNKIRWECLGTLKDLNAQTELRHRLTQAELEYNAKTDDLNYTSVANQGITIQQTAEKEVQAALGEGGLLNSIMAALLGGGGTAAILRKIWYTESEHQKAVNKETEKAVALATNGKTVTTI